MVVELLDDFADLHVVCNQMTVESKRLNIDEGRDQRVSDPPSGEVNLGCKAWGVGGELVVPHEAADGELLVVLKVVVVRLRSVGDVFAGPRGALREKIVPEHLHKFQVLVHLRGIEATAEGEVALHVVEGKAYSCLEVDLRRRIR